MITSLHRLARSGRFVGRRVVLGLICSLLLALPAISETPLDAAGFRINLHRATMIRGSTSPDQNWAIFHVTYRDTTASAFVFGSTNRKTLAGFAPSFHSVSSGRLDHQPTNTFQVVWSQDSAFVAIHDGGERHSKLHLFRVRDEKFARLQVPDLLKAAFPDIQLDRQPQAASGQVPIRWLTNDLLLVSVRLRARNKTKQEPLEVHVNRDDVVTATDKLNLSAPQ
jgi:hypothetical protein